MFPEITTQRFHLRKILSIDQRQIFEGLSDEQVIKYYGVSFKTYEEAIMQMKWYEDLLTAGTGIWWGIHFPGDREIIGACGFNNLLTEHKKAEVGYWRLPGYWKRGIMTEILPEIINYAFKVLHLHRIEATVETGNLSSKKLLDKLGFQNEGILKECELKNEKFIDLEYYSLLKKTTAQ